jgi:hypothetical protein
MPLDAITTLDTDLTNTAVKEAVLASSPSNPALQRLQTRLKATASTGEAITSYDRMHHRHSRS